MLEMVEHYKWMPHFTEYDIQQQMNKKKTIWNATIAVTQVIISAITLVILYKYLLNTLGVESLGIWSVVLATTSLSNISQFGLSGSVTKFVAKYLARHEYEKVEMVLKTAVVTIGVILSFTLISIYYPLIWVLGRIIPTNSFETAVSLLPFALVSMWFSSVSGVILSGLDGCQRIDLRGLLMIIGILLFTILAINIIPYYGLLGLAYAQILQNIFILIVGWLFIRKELNIFTILPIGWNTALFKEMIRYGVNFQIGAIAMMLLDPVTKMLMTKFGSLAMTGYFEMANRMVLQFRGIIVAANQVLVPVIATLKEGEASEIKKMYVQTFNLVVVLTLTCYGFIFVITPYVSEVWIGNYEPTFVFFAFMSILGWGVNTLSAPAYFDNLGTGALFWNTASHIIIGIINISVGLVAGYFLESIGVMLSYVLAIIIGSATILIMYNRKNNILFYNLLGTDSVMMLIACSLGCLLGAAPYYLFESTQSLAVIFTLSIALYLIPVLLVLNRNPQVKALKQFIILSF